MKPARLFREDASHLRALTGLRGWAALWVFMYHAWAYAKHPSLVIDLAGLSIDLTPLFSIGFAGVTIFFVLSGFLLSLPFAQWQAGQRERPRLGRYFFRRVMRVFPAYYAQLAILIAVGFVVPGEPRIEDGGALARHLAMLFVTPPVGTTPLNGVWWTLPIEFSFYLVLPVLALLLRPRCWILLLAGSLLSMYLWRYGVVLRMMDASLTQRVIAAYQLPGSMDAFGIGMLAAYLYVNRGRVPRWLMPGHRLERLGGPALLLVFAAVYLMPHYRHQYWADHPIFYLWTPALVLGVAGIILAGVAGGRLIAFLFSNRAMVFAGIVSYSFYLWHLPILRWLADSEWLPGSSAMRFAVLLGAGGSIVTVVAALSYLLIERPGMRFGRESDRG
jgi:peptidoglycan/LPS O-acetylase OafA/YrhL